MKPIETFIRPLAVAPEPKGNFILVLDLETTGLAGPVGEYPVMYGEDIYGILEIAGILFGPNKERLHEFDIVLDPQYGEIWDNETATFHKETGYFDSYRASEKHFNYWAEEEILKAIEKAIGAPLPDYNYDNDFKLILAGRSCWFDRAFLSRKMPTFAKKLAHFMIDTSSIKPILKEEAGIKTVGDLKPTHFAMDDCEAVVSDLEAYRLLGRTIPDDEETCLLTRLNNLGVR